MNKARSRSRGIASKCSSSSSSSSFCFSPNSFSNSNSHSGSNSSPTSKSSFTSNSNPTSNSSFTSDSSHISSFTNNKIDLTNKVCNRCGVVKQITSFDKKKSICKEYNSTKVKCEYCTSVLSFSGLKAHMKKSHKEKDFPRVFYSVNQRSCFTDHGTCFADEITPINEFIKSR